jgi:hypothetical protein
MARGLKVLACVFKETVTSQLPSMDMILNNGTIQGFSVEPVIVMESTHLSKHILYKRCTGEVKLFKVREVTLLNVTLALQLLY